MSAIPAFEIGVWNAWIFMPYLFLIMLAGGKLKKGEAPKNELDNLGKTEKSIFIFSKLVLFGAVIYSIFLPLELGTIWSYVGIPITLIGLATFTIVMVNFATTPYDEPITKGLYRYSRHPMYITSSLFLLGVGIASASWLFLLLSILFSISHFMNAVPEERFCLKQYGKAYEEYMNRTPKLIGIPKA
jgi:protein-S-isoprenylcysteine O-methyltransferase Ste14